MQGADQGARIRPGFRILVQHARQQPGQIGWQLGAQGRCRDRCFIDHPVNNGRQAVAIEGILPGEHFVQHGTQRKNIRASIYLASHCLFRRHVARRAEHLSDVGIVAVDEMGDPEIGQLDASAPPGDDDVGGLDVAVDDVVLVRERQRLGHLRGGIEHQIQRHRALVHEIAQGRAGKVFHGDIGQPIGLADVVDRHDIGMRQPAGALRFAQETGFRASPFLPQLRDGHGLDGDGAFDQRVARPINGAHRTLADFIENFVAADFHDGASVRSGIPRSDRARCGCPSPSGTDTRASGRQRRESSRAQARDGCANARWSPPDRESGC